MDFKVYNGFNLHRTVANFKTMSFILDMLNNKQPHGSFVVNTVSCV